MKIIAYKAIEYTRINELNAEVNRLIEEGWQPFGSINQVVCENYGYFTQAFVKYKE